MYELIIISFDGTYYTEIIKDCKRVDHSFGFVGLISNDGVCVFGVNENKLVSYKRLD